MKRAATVVASALVFGVVAGGSMVGVNVVAQKAGVVQTAQAVQETEAAESSAAANETAAAQQESTSTATASAVSSGSVSDVVKEAMPSVVAITNMVKYQQNGYSIFGNYSSQEYEAPASGSGVIIGKTDTELLIATNNHVVADSSSLSVTFCDDQTIDAQIKGTDASNDLAVVSVKLSDIPSDTLNAIKVITIGSSDDAEVGDQVVAIGNALGYGQSVTTGIISAKDRDVETSSGTETGLMQTDAAINPGNSGGALLNMKGELIGINVAKYSSQDVEGMGYSIPSSKAQSILDSLSSLTTRDEVPENERGYLGVQVKNIDKTTSQSFDMPQGVFIYKFTEGSSAENSGLQEKDIITKLDGQGVTTYDDLKTLLSKYRSGETVKVTVQRQDGSGKYQEVEVDVTLGSNPSATDNSSSSSSDSSQNPFEKGSGSSGNSGNDQSGSSDGSGSDNSQSSQDNEELWKEFQKFFNQYQR